MTDTRTLYYVSMDGRLWTSVTLQGGQELTVPPGWIRIRDDDGRARECEYGRTYVGSETAGFEVSQPLEL